MTAGGGHVPDRVEQFEADIAATPEALGRLLDAWQPPDLAARPRLVFTGLGSSRYAALVVAATLRATGASAWVEHASTTTPTPAADDTVLVAISASGRTAEVLEAVERHRRRSLVVGVTNDPNSPLADRADLVVALEAGTETSGIACRTFRATVAALAMLSGIAGPGDIRPAVDALATLHAERAAWLPTLVDALEGAFAIDVLADASLLGLAEQAALMLREVPRLPAHAGDTADWLHTGVYLALPGHRVLLYPGAAADAEVLATTERRGGQVATATSGVDPAAGTVVRAIVDSMVAESVALELWRRTAATDVTAPSPGRPGPR